MTRIWRSVAALGLLLIASGLLAPTARAESDEELYAAARKEGEVDFAGAVKEDATQVLLAAFSKKYPGIATQYTRRSTEPMVQMLEADRLAGKMSFDIINLTEPGDMVRYKQQGVLQPVSLPEQGILLPNTFDPEGFYYAVGITPMYGIYNNQVLTKETAPRSLKELLTDPKWVGKVAISRPSRGGTSAAGLLNVVDALGPDIIKAMPARDILLTRGNEGALSAVISGERPVSWGISGYRVLEAKAGGAPIDIAFWQEGTALSEFLGGVTAKARHPNAGKLLLRWLMTKDAQEMMVKVANFYSARKDVETAPGTQPPLSQVNVKAFSPERLVTEGEKHAKAFDEAIGLR